MKEGRQDSTRDGQLMKPQHTLLNWAAPASGDFCHRASVAAGQAESANGNKGSTRGYTILFS